LGDVRCPFILFECAGSVRKRSDFMCLLGMIQSGSTVTRNRCTAVMGSYGACLVRASWRGDLTAGAHVDGEPRAPMGPTRVNAVSKPRVSAYRLISTDRVGKMCRLRSLAPLRTFPGKEIQQNRNLWLVNE
jgi:hypothetical protein